MKRIFRYAAKAPKIACGVAILLVGLGALFLWGIKRGLQRSSTGSPAVASSVSSFRPADVVLCGNTLVDAGSGSIIARNWLEGFGNSSPTIAKVDEANGFVVVTGGRGAAQVFGFDGKPIPQPSYEGKLIGPAAYDMESDKRGLWLVGKTGEMVRVSNHPVDPAAGRPGAASLMKCDGGALFVSRGDLWRFELESRQVRQLAHDGGLIADLKALKP